MIPNIVYFNNDLILEHIRYSDEVFEQISQIILSLHDGFRYLSATRGRASQPKVLDMATDCSATCQQG